MTTARTGWRSHPIAATTALVLTALLMLLAHEHARSWADDYQANDNWANATVLASGSGSLYEFIQNATREPNEPLATGQHTVWFKWTAPFTGQAKFDTAVSTCGQNASMPTSITTWVGNSIKTLVLAGGANFNTTSGVTYSIAVNGTCGGTVGSLQLNWNPPAYADRGNAIVLPADAGTTWANNRGAAPVADSGFSVGSNGVRDSIIWFRWMPSVDGRAHVSTRGSSAENEIGAFYLDDQSKLTRLLDAPAANGSSDMDLAFDVVGNHQYWIAVGSPPFGPGVQPQGDIKLQWALNPPANDNLENAKGLGGHGTTIAGTNFRAT